MKSQQEMMAEGYHTPETYGEWAELQAGVLSQFKQTREILFNGVPFKAPNHAPTVAELEADVNAGRTISLLDLANAVNKERKTENPGKKPSLLGQLEKNKIQVAQNKENAQKDDPTRKPGELEVN